VSIVGSYLNISKSATLTKAVAHKIYVIKGQVEIGLQVNAKKTDYMVMSRHRHAGKNRNITISNKSSARVKESKYLGTT
jgi:hypothetical protein